MNENTLTKIQTSTPEQSEIISYKGRRLKVIAFSGTGKTSTLVKYALENNSERMLYLAFNRAIRDEAVSKFPKNVECKTSHQLAFASVGRNYTHKLRNNLRLNDIAQALPNTEANWSLVKDISKTLNTYIVSHDSRILEGHYCRELGGSRSQVMYRASVLDNAEMIWQKMICTDNTFPMTHDGYLKLYQLSLPDLSNKYTTILFDEAQDSNPVTNHIVLQQDCKIVYVGDNHQQIYRFRGANNALQNSLLNNADTLYLTHSFRFGRQIAVVANALLMLKNEKKSVIGRGCEDRVLKSMPSNINKYTILSRTVRGVITQALIAATERKKLYWVGGVNAYQLSELEDLFWFSKQQYNKVRDKMIVREFDDFNDFKSIAKATKDNEMSRAITLLKNFENPPKCIELILQQTVDDEHDADITLSTAHRCKGLQWDAVLLNNDFLDVLDPQLKDEDRIDEINLLYVSSTRAKKLLVINDSTAQVLRYAKAVAASKNEVV